MKLLSRIVFGSYFKIEKMFDNNLNDSTKQLFKLFAIKGIKGTIGPDIKLTWDERSKKFQFLGTLNEIEGKTRLSGEFVLGKFHIIRYLIWFSFWVIGYILWELGQIEFYREGDDTGFLFFIILGLIMLTVFLIRTNMKAKEIVKTIDEL